MKLKNSHILLIVMSLFLLISIGSVCASDAAMDADIQSANDGSDSVVLGDDAPSADATQIDTTVVSENVKVKYNETAEIPVTVKDNESNNVTIVKDDIKVAEANKTIKFNYTNNNIIIIDKLAVGNHSLIISYLGNDNYTASSTKMNLSIVGNNTITVPASVKTNGTNKTTVSIGLTDGVDVYDINKDNLKLTLSYKDGNVTKTKEIEDFELTNGKVVFNYDLALDTATLFINYTEEGKQASGNTTVNRARNIKLIPINTETEYATGNFTFKVIDVDTNEILSNRSIKVSGNKKNSTSLSWITRTGSGGYSINSDTTITTDSEGVAALPNENFYPGFYISTYTFAPNGDYVFNVAGSGINGSASVNGTIKKATINIEIVPYKEYYKSDKKVEIKVTNAKAGTPMAGVILHLSMPNTSAKDYYFQTDENGTSQINVSGLIAGTYQLSVSNNDTSDINYKNTSGNITILKIPAKINTKDYTIYYNSDNTATISLTEKSTGKAIAEAYVFIQLYTGSKSANYLLQTNSKGSVTFAVPLAVGKHKMVVSLADNRYDASPVTKTITVKKANVKISAVTTNAYYKEGRNFIVKVTNTKNNKAVYGAKLNIKVYISSKSYYSYTGQTGSDGKLRLKIDYNPGNYKVVVTKGESTNFTANSLTTKIIVKKAPTKLSPAKVTAKKGKNAYFKVTVKNTKLNKPIAGINVKIKVYTGKSFKTYTAKTNANGIAQLNVKSLSVGTHKVIVTSGNKYCTAKSATSSIKITK
ncbi:hypothetical protein [uncultured Methanobrevibacter sp.]|uniref:hypothetical protein n=1 Tax=uncultured Methanobrevibacter sp. TaxID=253161 RepID=UPI002635D5B0|nr:hypothetical protein [uncultured Methanobrevibacter sp.]